MNTLRYLFSPKMLVAGLGLVIAGLVGFTVINQSPVMAKLPEDCDNNAIIKCGFQNKEGFRADYNANTKGDIKTIYADSRFNFTSNEMDRFMKTAVWATAYKDGRIVLDDGRTVATNAWSIGREKFNGQREAIKIGGKTYYWSYTKSSFASNSIRALVMMDTNNKYMEFAVLTSCGNPITGTKPSFQCDTIKHTKKSNTQYEFWSEITAKNGASIKSIVYNFGDGKTATTTNPNQRMPHTYAKPGPYKVTVTVTYNVHGKEFKETVQTKCQMQITVKEEKKPVFVCESLKATPISRTKFTFTATGKSQYATLQSATFAFGDGQTATVQATTGSDTISTPHEYAKEDTYTAKVNLTYNIGTTKDTLSCMVKVKVNPPTCEETPEKPECQPPKQPTCEDTPNAPECQPPKEEPKVLPATGPLEMVGGALGLGSIAGAGIYYRNSRRNLIDRLLNR